LPPRPRDPKADAERAVERERLRRHIEDAREVVQRVVGEIDGLLALVARDPIAELDAAESEVLDEILGGDVAPLAHIRTGAATLSRCGRLGSSFFSSSSPLPRSS
jgi:hypothetical protein